MWIAPLRSGTGFSFKPNEEKRMADKELDDDDYVLTDQKAWFTVKGFAVRIHATDEGVAVDIYADGKETEGTISSAYALDSELKVEAGSDTLS